MSDNQTKLGVAQNVGGLLCNIPCCIGFIVSIVAVVIEKDNKFVRFHAFQSLLLHGAAFVVLFAIQVLSIVVSMAMGALGGLIGLIGLITPTLTPNAKRRTPPSSPAFRIKHRPQPIAHEVQREDRHAQDEAGPEERYGVRIHVSACAVDHSAPGWKRRMDTYA